MSGLEAAIEEQRVFGNGLMGLHGRMSLCQAVKTSAETSKNWGTRLYKLGFISTIGWKRQTVLLQTNHNDGSLNTAWRDCPTGVNSHQKDWRVQKGTLGVLQTSHFQRLNCGSPKKQKEVERPVTATAKCQDSQFPGQPKQVMEVA